MLYSSTLIFQSYGRLSGLWIQASKDAESELRHRSALAKSWKHVRAAKKTTVNIKKKKSCCCWLKWALKKNGDKPAETLLLLSVSWRCLSPLCVRRVGECVRLWHVLHQRSCHQGAASGRGRPQTAGQQCLSHQGGLDRMLMDTLVCLSLSGY